MNVARGAATVLLPSEKMEPEVVWQLALLMSIWVHLGRTRCSFNATLRVLNF
jgi:hypothetical protein